MHQQSNSLISSPRFNWFVGTILTLACVIAYFNTLDGEWVWDDVSSVLLHEHVQDPGQFFQLFREDQHAFGRGQGNFYRPLVAASFMFDYWISGGPRPEDYDARLVPDVPTLMFHISNMALHLAAALLFWRFLCLLGAPRFVQLAAPLIFVVHPLHTEAVAYISGRADMMSGVSIFAALCLVLLSFQTGKIALYTVCASLFLVAGLLSKESTLIYPVLLMILLPAMWESRHKTPAGAGLSRQHLAASVVSAWVILFLYIVLRATTLSFAQGGATVAAPFGQRLVETLQALGLYLQLLFVPANLHMERVMDKVSMAYAAAGFLFLLFMAAAIVAAWRGGHKRIAAGFAWFIASWLPISGIFPLNAPMAEHWMYVPMAGFWWALMELASLPLKRERSQHLALAAVAVFCVVFIGLTAHRNRDWHDNETLFRATLRENPNSARVQYNLAVTYEDLLRNYAGARRHYDNYLAIQALKREQRADGQGFALDEEVEARLALARVLMRLEAYEDAVTTLAPLIGLAETEAWRPTAALAAFQIGRAMLTLGEVGQANTYFEQAVRLEPQMSPDVNNVLSGVPVYEGY